MLLPVDITLREVEAAMALGFPDRDAQLEIAGPAASDALLPGLDQTRTVGLVTLPGAFVGMLLGGASPVQAGAVQLFVLVALMAVQAAAVATVLELVARGGCTVTGQGAGCRALRCGRTGLSGCRALLRCGRTDPSATGRR